MSIFQLDECINSKSLATECQQDGGDVRRYPHAMFGSKDPEMLAALVTKSTIVTSDKRISQQHAADIPLNNCGIIQLAVRAGPPPATLPEYKTLLARFKGDFVAWRTCDYTGSIVTITPTFIQVSHVEPGGLLVSDGVVDRNAIGWQRQLASWLEANRVRASSVPSAEQ